MDRSGSQKALLVIAIINIVFGAFALIAGLMMGCGGIVMGAASGSQLAEANVDPSTAAAATAVLGIGSVVVLISGAITVVEGILGVRAANDNQKIMPVWVLAIIGLVLAVISIIMSIVQGNFQITQLVSLIVSGLMFWIANNVKQEAGK